MTIIYATCVEDDRKIKIGRQIERQRNGMRAVEKRKEKEKKRKERRK